MNERFTHVDGLRIGYREEGNGLPLLILHGWGGSSASWERVGSILAPRGFRVVIPDLPGFGASDPPPAVWGSEEYARFAVSFADAVSMESFFLLGHSFGGQIAAVAASRAPRRVLRVVLAGAAIIRSGPRIKERIMRTCSIVFHLLFFFLPVPKLKENVRVLAYRILRRPDYIRAIGIMKDIMKKVIAQDGRAVLPDIRVPALVVWGEDDYLTPLREGKMIHSLLPSSSLIVIPKLGHNLHYQDPERLADEVTSFLLP